MKTRVLIADDELLARKRMRRLLGALVDVEIVHECKDGAEVLAAVERDEDIDIVLLDINMPGLSGLEAASVIDDVGPRVVFCTAHSEHAIEAFEKGAVDYLLKPVEIGRLKKAIERARPKPSSAERLDRLPISTRKGVVLVPTDEIEHASLEDELVVVVTQSARHLTDFSLNELEDKLPGFERVHRRALLNLAFVETLDALPTGGYIARTRCGDGVTVSRAAARRLRKKFGLS